MMYEARVIQEKYDIWQISQYIPLYIFIYVLDVCTTDSFLRSFLIIQAMRMTEALKPY